MTDRTLKSHLVVLAGLSSAIFASHMLTAALSSYGYFIIYVARRPRFSVVADWPKFKIFD